MCVYIPNFHSGFSGSPALNVHNSNPCAQLQVFFDRICISSDEGLKTQAIFSLAGLLKKCLDVE